MPRAPKLIFFNLKNTKKSVQPLELPTSGYAIDMSDSTKYIHILSGLMVKDRSEYELYF